MMAGTAAGKRKQRGAAGGPSCCGWQTERKRTPRPLGMTGAVGSEQQQRVAAARLREGRAAVNGKGLNYRVIGKQLNAAMTGTMGKRAAFGKRRQRGLREGRAAMGGKRLGQGDRRDGTQQTPREV